MALLADIFSAIETCKNMYETFQAVYDVFSKVMTNFLEQRRALMEEADFLMNKRVKNLSHTISSQPEDNLKDLRQHLQKIEEVFAEIVSFLEEVKETKSGTLVTFAKTLLGRYRSYQKQFMNFTEKLHDLGGKLDQLTTDVIPMVYENQKQMMAALQDATRDMKEMRKLLEELRGELATGTINNKSSKMHRTTLKKATFPVMKTAMVSSSSVTPASDINNELLEIETLLDKVEAEVKTEIELELQSIR